MEIPRIAIIGAGNMGGAVALGLHRFAPGVSLTVTTAHDSSIRKYAEQGIDVTLDNKAAAASADIIILGVKPWLVQSVLTQIGPELSGKVLLSMAAGIRKSTGSQPPAASQSAASTPWKNPASPRL